MRISTAYQYDSYRKNVSDTNTQYFFYQQQLSTGKKFERAGQDPLAATLSLDARRLRSRVEQYDANLRSAKDYLGSTENALSEMTTIAQQAYSLAIQGGSDAIDQSARQALVGQVAELQKRLASLGNTQGNSGQYIFAGHKTDVKPFAENAGALDYNGDSGAITVETKPAEYVQANLADAATMFQGMYNALTTLKNNLASGNVIQLSQGSVDEMKGWVDQAVQTRGDVGNKLQTVDRLAQLNRVRIDDLTKEISTNEDIDFAETFVKYQAAQTAYQASLQVTSQGMQMSLMDFIR